MRLEVPICADRPTGGRWILIAAVVVLICGAFLRLSGLDDLGLNGSDNTYYTTMAWIWSEGDRAYEVGGGRTLYHRPVVFWVYAQAVRLLGFNDASIKIVNASLDTINILLVFLLAFILSRRNLWAASSATIIYALLPFSLLISRSELTHTLSTSTVLVAMILLSLSSFAERRIARLSLTLLAGAATGLGALTHEEIIFTAAAPTLFLLLAGLNRGDGVQSRLIAAASWAGSYLLGVFLIAYRMLQTHEAEAQVRAAGVVGRRISHGTYLQFIERPLKYSWNALVGSTSTLLACLVIVLVLVLMTRFFLRLKKTRSPGWRVPALPIEDLLPWTVVGLIVLNSFFFSYYQVRLFVPLIPLVIVWLVVRSTSLMTQLAGCRATKFLLSVLTVAVVAANFGHIVTYQDSIASHFETWTPFSLTDDFRPGIGWSDFQKIRTSTSWARNRYEELGGAVTDESRLLLGASATHTFPGRRLLQTGYYFGDNSVYLFDHDQPIDQLIEDKNIGFVLFTTYQADDSRLKGEFVCRRYRYGGSWGPYESVRLGKSLGIADGEYTIQEEFERLRAEMADRGARIILGRRDLLERRPTGTDPVSFVVWVLDPKDWPPLEREIEAISRSLELAAEDRLTGALETLDAAETPEIDDLGRFRLRLTGARILVEHGQPGKAAQRVEDAMAVLPRNTTVSTALRDAYPTVAATAEMYRLFADLQTIKPRDRALRDLLLALAVNLADFAIEVEDQAESIDAFDKIEQQLLNPGNRKFTVAIADWCASTYRDLSRDGRAAEAQACLAARSAAVQ